MSSHRGITIALLVASATATAPAEAQVWKKVKSSVAQRVDARKHKADSAVVRAAAGVVDSTLAQGNRVVDAGATHVGEATSAAINRTERGVVSAFTAGGSRSMANRFASDLAGAGRATALHGADFAPGSAELQTAIEPTLKAIATALKAGSASYLIEGHTDPSGDAAADQALSERRAAAVKARLVALGVPASRLFATGLGATRPLADAPQSSAAANAGPDSAGMSSGKAAMAKSVAEAVIPGAKLLGMGAKVLKARQGQAQAAPAQGGAPPAGGNARIEIARMQ